MKTVVGSIIAAIGASACCLGPPVFSLIGAGALGAASARVEPLRPVFLGLTGVLLVAGFVLTYRRRPVESCGPGEPCPPARGRAAKLFLWIATVIVILLVTFPYVVALIGVPATAEAQSKARTEKAVLNIPQMDCGGCELAVEI
ncbi:MAG: mercuric transporter MerT family protein, partial [bacterium]